MTGADYERALARLLSDLQYSVMRSPASGGGTPRDQPDILAAKPEVGILACELKSGGGEIVYVNEAEVLALESFAALFEADPYLVARYTDARSSADYWFVRPEDARVTPLDNYALPLEDIEDRAAMRFHSNDAED